MSRQLTAAEIQADMKRPDNRSKRSSPADVRLRKMFEKKELIVVEDPKQAWLADPLFQQHNLANFHTCYKSMRQDYSAP